MTMADEAKKAVWYVKNYLHKFTAMEIVMLLLPIRAYSN